MNLIDTTPVLPGWNSSAAKQVVSHDYKSLLGGGYSDTVTFEDGSTQTLVFDKDGHYIG